MEKHLSMLCEILSTPLELVFYPLPVWLGFRPQLQVLYSVIVTDTVYVVYVFTREQCTAQVPRHDKTMLRNYAMLRIGMPWRSH